MKKFVTMETFVGYKRMCEFYENKGYQLVSVKGYCNHTYAKYYPSSNTTEYVNVRFKAAKS